MRLLVTLLVLFLAAPAYAQTTARPVFEIRLAATVFSAGFAFISSRALEEARVDQVALWGLGSLTALDGALLVQVRDGSIHLHQGGRSVFQRGLPPAASAEEWGPAVADVISAAFDVSDPVRRSGTQGVISAVFAEALSHLDPYSRYVPPGAADLDRERRSGEAGIGLRLLPVPGGYVVQSVTSAGPAAEAGIVAGERLLAVDDAPVAGETLETVQSWLAGLEGTDVAVTLRGRDGRTRTLEIERAVVPAETVSATRSGTLLTLRITGFNADTAQRLTQELDRTLSGAAGDRVRGIVLDLRGNRGGLLRQAVATTDLLLGAGLIAKTSGRNPSAAHDFRATTGDHTEGRPIVVLVDGRSASAAEIMAAALADNGRAVVVGSATLGKGLVQTIATLPDGAELFVTWSRVLAPGGWPIQGLGLMPQVCTSLGAESVSQQLQSLGRGLSRMAPAVEKHHAARIPLPPAGIVDLRTPCPAADGREADVAAARFLLGNPRAYAAALIAPP